MGEPPPNQETEARVRLLDRVDRWSRWTARAIAVALFVGAFLVVRDMLASKHGAFGVLLLPIALLISWVLWALKSPGLRIGAILLLFAACIRTCL